MAKQKHKRESEALYAQVIKTTSQARQPGNQPNTFPFCDINRPPSVQRELPKMKKFRFQLLHQWMVSHLQPGRVADIGGGKGLLTFLLQSSGWSATVIDPVNQALPSKYKDLLTNKQTPIAPTAQVPRIDAKFEPGMAQNFDLLVAMHAHGCNIQLIDAAAKFGCALILLPCCVIHEPILPPPGVQWIEWLAAYLVEKGFIVQPFQLNFKGQNIGFYAEKVMG